MKPRPFSNILVVLRAKKSTPISQFRRSVHSGQTCTLYSLSNRQWYNCSHDASRDNLQSCRLHLRYASSAATTAKSRRSPQSPASAQPPVPVKSPSSTLPIPQIRAKLNPPPQTYAPELQVPARRPDQGMFKYLYQCGRLYIGFYKQGIANVRATAKLAKTFRAKAAKAPVQDRDTVLTRAEWQVVRRSRRDMLRLPAFGILVLILGEWLPLIAMYITPLIPEPCRIPKQVARKLEKQESRRKEREHRLAIDAARLVARDRRPGMTNSGDLIRPEAVKLEELDKMDLYSLLSLSTRLDAHGWVWDRLFLTPPKGWLRWDVRRKLEYLRKDDNLIARDGGWQALESREAERVCIERGIKVLGRNEGDLRRELASWFKK